MEPESHATFAFICTILTSTPAYADSGGPKSSSAQSHGLRPNQGWIAKTTPEKNQLTPLGDFGTASGDYSCHGVSAGNWVSTTSLWGNGYQDCQGVGIVLQQQDVRIIWCISTPFGLCYPFEDVGQLAYREIYTGGGFWAPSAGSAQANVTSGRTYMIQTHHKVFWMGGTLQGDSQSYMFYVG